MIADRQVVLPLQYLLQTVNLILVGVLQPKHLGPMQVLLLLQLVAQVYPVLNPQKKILVVQGRDAIGLPTAGAVTPR
jgi:biotin transporter BioY